MALNIKIEDLNPYTIWAFIKGLASKAYLLVVDLLKTLPIWVKYTALIVVIAISVLIMYQTLKNRHSWRNVYS